MVVGLLGFGLIGGLFGCFGSLRGGCLYLYAYAFYSLLYECCIYNAALSHTCCAELGNAVLHVGYFKVLAIVAVKFLYASKVLLHYVACIFLEEKGTAANVYVVYLFHMIMLVER